MTNLQSLDLRSNQLSQLPPVIYQLGTLEQLQLGHYGNQDKANQITELSSDILHLDKLRNLDVYGQPLQIPPPEVVDMNEDGQANLSKIRSYFEQLEQEGVDYLYEAKLLVVGEAGAGKTTLTRKIQNPLADLPTEEESTKGLEIASWPCPTDDKNYQVNIWDFGGQEIYHATHQFFLTKRSLYILVADNRKEDTDFYYWLNIIELLTDNSPVLILNNKRSGRERPIDGRTLRGHFDNLQNILATNLATDNTLDEIYATIKYQMGRLPHIGTPLPKSWVRVRRALEDNPHNYILLPTLFRHMPQQRSNQHLLQGKPKRLFA